MYILRHSLKSGRETRDPDTRDSISSDIDEVLSINPSANVFVFEGFDVHHKDWLTYSGGTDRTGELCYNFSISNDLTQIVDFPTQIPHYDSHSPALLHLFLSSDLSYIIAELFNMCRKKSCFPDCWKVSSVVPVFKNVGERSTAKNYHPVTLLPVVSKVFEKRGNNRTVDHPEKCGLFSDFQYGLRSSRSSADLVIVPDRNAFNRSGATRVVALDIVKTFDRVWHAGLLHKLKSYGISG